MADYKTKDIRNIALLGHGSEGKTTLTEAMLFAAGMIDRQGKVEAGTTVTDFDAEENKRGISISAATAPVEWKGTKINLIDVPGYFDFIGEMMGPLRVVETAAILVSAVSGLTVGAEKAWAYAKKNNVCRMFIVNRMDAENANYEKTIEQLREKFGSSVVPLMLPIGEGAKFTGVVNVLENKAYSGKGKDLKEIPVPADMAPAIENALAEITEAAAEAVDELLEKYFEEGELSHEEILQGFSAGMKSGSIVPAVPVSAVTGVGVAKLLDVMSAYLHSPEEASFAGVNPKNDEEIIREGKTSEPFSAFVFKTIADPFVGKLSMLRVCSGTLTSGTALYNSSCEKTEKAGGLFLLRGKNQLSVSQVSAGDIAALSKLQFTNTGDTLCDAANPIRYEKISFPEPSVQKAVYAAKQGEEDKVFSGLARLQEEDPSIRLEKNAETTETILWGQGELHLDVIRNKLQSKFGANAVLQDPRIPYRETIRKTVSCQGRHKKQSGGHGQFGDVWIEFKPCDSEGLEFGERVVGGSVPKGYFPAVEKGLQECIAHGPLAGYPVVGLRATLYDGSYHPVDSSEMAFKTAASLAYKAGMPQASPVLLEPIGTLRATVPDANMGDIMGEVNKRRGRVLGMEPAGPGKQTVEAEVPVAEMHDFCTFVRQVTQGRGSYTFDFTRYEEAPAQVAQKVIEQAKAGAE